MYSKEQICQILFLDIETARNTKTYAELSEGMRKMWELKSQTLEPKDGSLSPEEKYYDKAAIYAEFGRVICISCGFIYEKDGEICFKAKSFYGKDERKILEDFKVFLDSYTEILGKTGFYDRKSDNTQKKKFHYLAAHNGKEFDIPYMGRRYLVNQLPLPQMLDVRGKKPWEVPHLIDTMELWKFGDGKNFTKLELLCNIFNIPTPKDDIDGSQVGQVFWDEENYERIAIYCEKDVLATAQLMLKYNLFPLVDEDKIYFAEKTASV